jgi:hypothetical protein
MSPCDYDLFAKMKEPLRGTRYNTREEIIHAVGRSLPDINRSGRQIQEAPIQRVDETYEIPTRPDFSLITQTVNAYPDQIGRVIKSAGPFIDGEDYFVPALSCEQRDRHGRYIPQSERIVLSNLRETVVALSTVETPQQVREVFYMNMNAHIPNNQRSQTLRNNHNKKHITQQ